jgi:hypothetical protein
MPAGHALPALVLGAVFLPSPNRKPTGEGHQPSAKPEGTVGPVWLQNRTFGPHLAATHRILIPVVNSVEGACTRTDYELHIVRRVTEGALA